MALRVRKPSAKARSVVARGAEAAAASRPTAINLRIPGGVYARIKDRLGSIDNPPSMTRWIIDAAVQRLDGEEA